MNLMRLSMRLACCALLLVSPAGSGCGGSALAPPGLGDSIPDGAADAADAGGLDCVGGSTRCGQACVELDNDPANCGACGACGVTCGVAGVCVNAACTTLGGAPPGPSDAATNGVADGSVEAGTTVRSIPEAGADANAGDAGGTSTDAATCASSLCQGRCVDTSSDPANCGACGAACMALQACSQGGCVCAAGATSCDGVCVDTSIDAAHCGGCATPCAGGSVCTDGACAAASSDWPTFAYDAKHSGNNTQETGVPPAIDSWSTTINVSGSALSPVAVENGRAFVSDATYFDATSPLVALDVSDGSTLWSYNFGAVESVGYPSVAAGTVYVQTNHGTSGNNSYLWALDAAAGTVTWSAAFGSQWEHFWPPLVVGSSVFVDGGEYGGLYGFAVADGSQIFFNSALGQYDSWSAASFGGDLYTFIDGSFCAEDPATGNVLSTTTLSWTWTGYSMDTSPVFGASYGYVISPPNLVAINPATNAVAWTANGTYSGTPAVANGVVYGISAGNLVARDASTGALLFTLVGDQNLKYPPVVSAGYVYASSDANVYAWNVATHARAWTAPVGGWLAIAARRLLVASADGVLHGFVLSRP